MLRKCTWNSCTIWVTVLSQSHKKRAIKKHYQSVPEWLQDTLLKLLCCEIRSKVTQKNSLLVEIRYRAKFPGHGECKGSWDNVTNTLWCLCKTENHSRVVATSQRASKKDQEESWIPFGLCRRKKLMYVKNYYDPTRHWIHEKLCDSH